MNPHPPWFLTISILAVESSVLLDNLEFLGPRNQGYYGDDLFTTSSSNCSHRFRSDPGFNFRKFQGTWQYLRFSTSSPSPILISPPCMKLAARVNDRKIHMQVQFSKQDMADRNNNSTRRISLVASVDMNKEREDIPGLWSLYSEKSLAPSKWIVISGSSYTVLYMICGDFPGGSSRVGEIGLLRRGIPKLSDSARLREILANYSLDVVLDNTSQYDCE